jgi:hypothetical protein
MVYWRDIHRLFSGTGFLEQSAKLKQTRKSTEGWELALRINIAEDCRQRFMEKVTTIEDMEIRSTEALELLTKR